MSASTKITLRIRFAWWLKHYLCALLFLAHVMRRTPDAEKLGSVIGHAIRVEVV